MRRELSQCIDETKRTLKVTGMSHGEAGALLSRAHFLTTRTHTRVTGALSCPLVQAVSCLAKESKHEPLPSEVTATARHAAMRHQHHVTHIERGARAAVPVKWSTIALVVLGWLGACTGIGWLLMAWSGLAGQ